LGWKDHLKPPLLQPLPDGWADHKCWGWLWRLLRFWDWLRFGDDVRFDHVVRFRRGLKLDRGAWLGVSFGLGYRIRYLFLVGHFLVDGNRSRREWGFSLRGGEAIQPGCGGGLVCCLLGVEITRESIGGGLGQEGVLDQRRYRW